MWPGQAPGYLLGMDVILGARDSAQAALGPDFDFAGFHDAVLGHGSIPLPLIDDVVTSWIAHQTG